MYLHLGQNVVVRGSSVVGIFDIENTSISKITKEFLSTEEKMKRVVNVSTDLPKSFVVCRENGKNTVYISQISCATLKKRSGYLEEIRLTQE